MESTGFLCILCGMWDVVKEPLNGFLGWAVDDSLRLLWGRVVANVRDFTRFWGNQIEQVPISSTGNLAGLDEIRTYEREIVAGLHDDRVGVIGIHGMGGVGKTTLLERINNSFRQLGAPGFDVVIWVTVSQEVDLLKMQKSVAERIRLILPTQDPEERARHIFKALCKRRFLLLVDDLWEKIKLRDVGIPQPTAENRCKVILTTRSTEVCHKMGAKKLLELKVLNESESWKLFKENVGAEVDLDAPLIKPHARAVVSKCGGLPLALITVGCAMADVKSEGEWREALRQLSQSPHELPGMTNDVLSLLKFSYDRLAYETLKQCLLYCCLHPEDSRIRIKGIIDQWVGEGFVGTVRSSRVEEGRNRGRGVITRLVKASLLQYDGADEVYVKMHDMVRDMCLWITGEIQNADKNNAFLMLADEEWNHVSSYSYERWNDKIRISLRSKKPWVLPDTAPSCPHLRSMFFFRALDFGPEVSVIPQGFFSFMPVLRVLNLPWADVESLPDDVGLLTELRYLNLDCTRIKSLPKGLGKLTNLILLSLNHTRYLTYIPREAVPVITNLRVLHMFESSYDLLSELIASPPTDDRRGEHSITPPTSFIGESLKDDYYCWKNMEELKLSIRSLHSFEVLLNSDTLCKCCVDVHLSTGEENIPAEHLSTAFQKIQNFRFLKMSSRSKEAMILDVKSELVCKLEVLELLYVWGCVVEINVSHLSFRNLLKLEIFGCHGIHTIAWVRHLPCIQVIILGDCEEIEEVLPAATTDGVGGEDDGCLDSSSLLSLKWLMLNILPALRCISSGLMLFPSLEGLVISHCPKLEKLPLTASSAPNLRDIRCSRRLWEGLGTADGGNTLLQSRLLPFYSERD